MTNESWRDASDYDERRAFGAKHITFRRGRGGSFSRWEKVRMRHSVAIFRSD